MSIGGFFFVNSIGADAFSSSINISNMLYLKVVGSKLDIGKFYISVFFSSLTPPITDHEIKEEQLRDMFSDIVVKNKVTLLKIDVDGGFVFVPLGSVLYIRDFLDDSIISSTIMLSNSLSIKSTKKIDMDAMGSIVIDHLSLEKVI